MRGVNGGIRMSLACHRLVITAMLGVLAICAAGMASAQAPKGRIVLYTSHPERDAAQTVAAFRRAQPGVEVDVFRSGTTEVMGKLAAEFAAGSESLETALFPETDIPWGEIAFRSVAFCLKAYFADRRAGHFAFHEGDLPPLPTIDRQPG